VGVDHIAKLLDAQGVERAGVVDAGVVDDRVEASATSGFRLVCRSSPTRSGQRSLLIS